MLFFLNLDGTITRGDSDRVFQGQNQADKIELVSAISNIQTGILVGFELPNGLFLEPLPMQFVAKYELDDKTPALTLYKWELPLAYNITDDAGTIKVSFGMTRQGANGQPIVVSTSYCDVVVEMSALSVDYNNEYPADIADAVTLLTNYYNQNVALIGEWNDRITAVENNANHAVDVVDNHVEYNYKSLVDLGIPDGTTQVTTATIIGAMRAKGNKCSRFAMAVERRDVVDIPVDVDITGILEIQIVPDATLLSNIKVTFTPTLDSAIAENNVLVYYGSPYYINGNLAVRWHIGNYNIDEVTATVDNQVGIPRVDVVEGGTPSKRTYTFNFYNIKGEQGIRGEKGERGEPFAISIIYDSVADMNAGASTDGVPNGGFALIETGDVNNPDNAKLYVKSNGVYVYVTDMSGAQGIQGPAGAQGRGIERISLTTTFANIDQYTIYYTDGTTSTFQVVNGRDGKNGEQGEQGIQGVQGVAGTQIYTITIAGTCPDELPTSTRTTTIPDGEGQRAPLVGDLVYFNWMVANANGQNVIVFKVEAVSGQVATCTPMYFLQGENAQGGDFLEKTTEPSVLYGTTANGDQRTYPVTYTPTVDAIPRYDGNSRLYSQNQNTTINASSTRVAVWGDIYNKFLRLYYDSNTQIYRVTETRLIFRPANLSGAYIHLFSSYQTYTDGDGIRLTNGDIAIQTQMNKRLNIYAGNIHVSMNNDIIKISSPNPIQYSPSNASNEEVYSYTPISLSAPLKFASADTFTRTFNINLERQTASLTANEQMDLVFPFKAGEQRVAYLSDLEGGGGSVTIDDALSTTSENPVQNKVITEQINSINAQIGNAVSALAMI